MNRIAARDVRRVLPAATGGLLAGHILTYLLVAPGAAQRHALLHHTGHGYLSKAIAVGAALAALAAAASAGRGVARWRTRRGTALSWAGLASRLAILQASGFVLLEIVERLAVGAPLGGLYVIAPVGVAVQVLVAAGLAAVLCLTDRAAEHVARAIGSPPALRRSAATQRRAHRRSDSHRSVLDLLSSSVTRRGPPMPSWI